MEHREQSPCLGRYGGWRERSLRPACRQGKEDVRSKLYS